jgi:DNA polymerase III epsilon subunit family exonuclease
MSYRRDDWVDCKGSAAAMKAFDAGVAFIALDFETTGLYADRDRICEFGAVKFNRDGILGEFGCLCDPGMPISPDASRVSGLYDSMVRGKAPVDSVIPEFLSFLRSCPLMAHNAPFDLGFLRQAQARAGLPGLTNDVYDTRLLAKEAFPGLPKYSLQELNARLGIDPGQAHRALDDAMACMRLFLKCLDAIKARRACAEPAG